MRGEEHGTGGQEPLSKGPLRSLFPFILIEGRVKVNLRQAGEGSKLEGEERTEGLRLEEALTCSALKVKMHQGNRKRF